LFELKKIISGSLLTVVLLASNNAFPQIAGLNPEELKSIDVIEHSGDKIPFDLHFINDKGDSVMIGDYFNQGKPVVLILAYYECPMLCTLVLNGMSEGVRKLGWTPGDKFQLVTVSIDPRETWELAAGKKKTYLADLNMPAAADGWAFLAGAESQSKALAEALGFKYYYDEKNNQYAHPAVAFILTSDGRISRYLYGIEFKPRDLKLALLEASEGKVGSTLDRIILYCYHYDPKSGGYVAFASNIMKLGGGFTLTLLILFFFIMWRFEKHKKSKKNSSIEGGIT